VPASFTDDVDLMIEETKAAARTASACIVDGGHPDMDRDLAALTRIAAESGVPIVASGGYYMQRNYPPELTAKTADQLPTISSRCEGAAAWRLRRDRTAGRRSHRR
jgi:predicted metal-dependent phosphotriesterase family hydrolase